jgi:hypothetical protein
MSYSKPELSAAVQATHAIQGCQEKPNGCILDTPNVFDLTASAYEADE